MRVKCECRQNLLNQHKEIWHICLLITHTFFQCPARHQNSLCLVARALQSSHLEEIESCDREKRGLEEYIYIYIPLWWLPSVKCPTKRMPWRFALDHVNYEMSNFQLAQLLLPWSICCVETKIEKKALRPLSGSGILLWTDSLYLQTSVQRKMQMFQGSLLCTSQCVCD